MPSHQSSAGHIPIKRREQHPPFRFKNMSCVFPLRLNQCKYCFCFWLCRVIQTANHFCTKTFSVSSFRFLYDDDFATAVAVYSIAVAENFHYNLYHNKEICYIHATGKFACMYPHKQRHKMRQIQACRTTLNSTDNVGSAISCFYRNR